jgi:hypothetical protein
VRSYFATDQWIPANRLYLPVKEVLYLPVNEVARELEGIGIPTSAIRRYEVSQCNGYNQREKRR